MSGTTGVRGVVGPPQRFHLSGWTFDPDRPDAHLAVEIWLDGERIGETSAHLFFDHLAKAGVGKGDHGFVFNADRELPVAERHRLEVFAIGASGRKALGFATRAPAPAATPLTPKLRFPQESSDASQRPVFILGSARSGTSALAQALARNTRFAGHGEGHLLDLASGLGKAVEGHYERRRGEWAPGVNTMIAAAPQEFLGDAVRYGFVALARALFPSGFWLDKTPRAEMTRAAPALLSIWPNARFVFMRRRAFENIESRRRKFPGVDFYDHCVGWADSIAAWEEVRPALAGRAVEMDQFVLSREPARATEALATLLDLDAAECARLSQALSVDRPERTSARFAELYEPEELDWSVEQWEVFDNLCAPTFNRLGYARNRDYFLPGWKGKALVAL